MPDTRFDAALAPLTTLNVGGPATELVLVTDPADLVATCLSVWSGGGEWMILGGGSNVVVSDDGFAGTVVHIATRGVEVLEAAPGDPAGTVRVRVQAGEPWDSLVAFTVQNGFSGIEALSGIPGSTGASPVQNIGAYGQEVASAIAAVEFLDYETGELQRLSAHDLGFGYRTSVLKRGREGVVVSVELRLAAPDGGGSAAGAGGTAVAGAGADALGQPVLYPQLAKALGVEVGDAVAVGQVRDAVLRLRASKGMVLDPADPDSVSAGSFFTNPIVSESFARTLPLSAPRWPVVPAAPAPAPAAPEPAPRDSAHDGADSARPFAAAADDIEYQVKLSAAWLIEQAGIRRGFALAGSSAAISSKHTLALINRGGATAEQISELARFVQWRVQAEFGVNLSPEPVFIGFGPVDDVL
ncbi:MULTISPECIES: UDP-N-acetylmuramate dehydrogenase [Subtercola]|uniref:UDP-N-acetylenolpyruvoylglucosamine reductase n=1 Tax=Subtercola vilae TaxID=2056433 RepID=A0A4T2C5E2_9MICO|nr:MULTISPECIES: UDP-N-acetylmuramate dehydrogenase [Subtercola]MEA9984806.1 UDP-N-acetylmuramate dehydrogenase [Subtercola sp. RTI3]TIH38969.1 UDP-N-acetylmuramate dehydrogenase [Subtercola vilae]